LLYGWHTVCYFLELQLLVSEVFILTSQWLLFLSRFWTGFSPLHGGPSRQDINRHILVLGWKEAGTVTVQNADFHLKLLFSVQLWTSDSPGLHFCFQSLSGLVTLDSHRLVSLSSLFEWAQFTTQTWDVLSVYPTHPVWSHYKKKWTFLISIFGVALGRYSTAWATPAALFCVGYFPDKVLWTICLGLALKHDPPDLCLLSSLDYRREPQVPGFSLITVKHWVHVKMKIFWIHRHPSTFTGFISMVSTNHDTIASMLTGDMKNSGVMDAQGSFQWIRLI
jgi:hypothetical protein